MNEQWFWEQCGFTFIFNFDDPSVIEESRSPIGERISPVIDLNNLFKYAVPAVDWVTLTKKFGKDEWVGTVNRYTKDEYTSENRDPALALFGAIYKAFGGK